VLLLDSKCHEPPAQIGNDRYGSEADVSTGSGALVVRCPLPARSGQSLEPELGRTAEQCRLE
jgi:hypothetical protein